MILCKMNMPETEVHDELRSALLEAFGGYTVMYGTGGWRDGSGMDHYDNMVVYEVAMDATRENFDRFVEIATGFATLFGEQAVYYVIDGEPEIVDLSTVASGAAEPQQPTTDEMWGDYFKNTPTRPNSLFDYTLADDALAAVAKHVREATLENFAKHVALSDLDLDKPPVDHDAAFRSWFEEEYPDYPWDVETVGTSRVQNLRRAFIAGRKS